MTLVFWQIYRTFTWELRIGLVFESHTWSCWYQHIRNLIYTRNAAIEEKNVPSDILVGAIFGGTFCWNDIQLGKGGERNGRDFHTTKFSFKTAYIGLQVIYWVQKLRNGLLILRRKHLTTSTHLVCSVARCLVAENHSFADRLNRMCLEQHDFSLNKASVLGVFSDFETSESMQLAPASALWVEPASRSVWIAMCMCVHVSAGSEVECPGSHSQKLHFRPFLTKVGCILCFSAAQRATKQFIWPWKQRMLADVNSQLCCPDWGLGGGGVVFMMTTLSPLYSAFGIEPYLRHSNSSETVDCVKACYLPPEISNKWAAQPESTRIANKLTQLKLHCWQWEFRVVSAPACYGLGLHCCWSSICASLSRTESCHWKESW